MGRDRIIEAYIQRLLSWEQPLTSNTFAVIAEEVGITKSEVDAISVQSKSHLTRGCAYVEFGCLDDAINELNQSASLAPLNLDVLHALANAYNQRYNRTNDKADRQKALLIAKRCIKLKPDDQESLVLISFLEHSPAKSKQKASQWTRQKLAVVAGSFALAGIGIIGLSRLPIFSKPLDPLGPAPGTIVPGSVIYESKDDKEPVEASPAQIDLTSDVDIPVMFDHPGLVMEARLSELGDYEDALYYQLQGVFINASDQEFRNLVIKVQFLDRNDVEIAAIDKTAISDEDAIILPGDTHTFNLLQKVTPELKTVRLSVITLQQVPARKTYVPPTPINYSWKELAPENISFELASRSEAFGVAGTSVDNSESVNGTGSSNSNNDEDTSKEPKPHSGPATFNAEWVIINTSDIPLRELKLKADFYSANNRLLQSEDVFAIDNNDAPLLPGETRPFRVIKPVVKGYEQYRVTVVEAE
ncbi:MAG: hypothetical protein KTR27_16180 [Leptolyngbyaceae cyanobacterium MAG.088]|nr:hypothetical protein [Leptolyngbyaceae cyanobacterium MAG.088]